jgi:hypothetical protein
MFKHGEYYADFDTVSMKPIGKLESISDRKMYVECFFDNNHEVTRLLIHTENFFKNVREYKRKGDFLYNENIVEEYRDIDKFINYLGFGREIRYRYHKEKETDAFEFSGIHVCDFINFTESTYYYDPIDERKLVPYGSFKDFEALSKEFGIKHSFFPLGKYLKMVTVNTHKRQDSRSTCYKYSGNSMFWIHFNPEFVFLKIDCDSL